MTNWEKIVVLCNTKGYKGLLEINKEKNLKLVIESFAKDM